MAFSAAQPTMATESSVTSADPNLRPSPSPMRRLADGPTPMTSDSRTAGAPSVPLAPPDRPRLAHSVSPLRLRVMSAMLSRVKRQIEKALAA